jgi:hypothetical protein
MKHAIRALVASFACFVVTPSAFAQSCSSAGKQQFSGGTMQYCDGSNWRTMKGASNGGCSGAGRQQYSSGVMQFCDGSNWFRMKFASVAGCSGGEAGKQRFSGGKMQFCDGGAWYDMTAATSCPAGYSLGSGTCTQCSAGTFSPGGVSVCSTCGTDTYSSAGAGSCSSCAWGQYSQPGSGGCSTCTNMPAHATSVSYRSTGGGINNCTWDVVTCESGYDWDGVQCGLTQMCSFSGGSRPCDTCPAGYYDDECNEGTHRCDLDGGTYGTQHECEDNCDGGFCETS